MFPPTDDEFLLPPDPKKDYRTSYGRFYLRLETFKKKYKVFPRTRHFFWWLVHNIPVHFLIAVMPIRLSFKLHDWTSKKLNLRA